MLYHLEPSVELTGGPWYTDGELDSEFIKLLCRACYRIIKEKVHRPFLIRHNISASNIFVSNIFYPRLWD